MSYSVYYPADCAQAVPDHVCDGCIGDNVEHGRVRSLAFIKASYYATLLAAVDVAATWKTGIADKSIIIIPEVSGSYDGGSPLTGPGYGNAVDRLIGYDHTLNVKDPNYKANAPFYNAIKYSNQYHVAYVTESQVHLSGKPARITPKAPVEEDIASEVVWNVEIKWKENDIPAPVETPAGVFENCFQYE